MISRSERFFHEKYHTQAIVIIIIIIIIIILAAETRLGRSIRPQPPPILIPDTDLTAMDVGLARRNCGKRDNPEPLRGESREE